MSSTRAAILAIVGIIIAAFLINAAWLAHYRPLCERAGGHLDYSFNSGNYDCVRDQVVIHP